MCSKFIVSKLSHSSEQVHLLKLVKSKQTLYFLNNPFENVFIPKPFVTANVFNALQVR